jgi:hypothetical protein
MGVAQLTGDAEADSRFCFQKEAFGIKCLLLNAAESALESHLAIDLRPPFSLVAGPAIDNLGLRRVLPIAAATGSVGALLFATANRGLASLGRLMLGAGGVFALVLKRPAPALGNPHHVGSKA